MRARLHDAGYTLLEMLVALVIFGMIMAGLAQTFRFGLTAAHFGAHSINTPEDMADLDAALTRMIGQAVPGTLKGRPNSLAFTTKLPAGAGFGGGLADVAITATPDGELILRYGPHPPGILLIAPPPPQIEPLAPGIAGFTASYLGAASGGKGWVSSWSSSAMPRLVRLHIDFVSGQIWPDLVAAPVNAGG